jgi:Tol biopolymer transport system component
MEVQRTAVPVLDDVAYDATFGFVQVDVSRTGTLAYRRNAGGGQLIAEWLDASGHAEPLTANPGRYLWPRLSPNGERLALSVIESGATTIWIYDQLSHSTTRRVANVPKDGLPIWSPDARSLVLGGPDGLATVTADGTENPAPLIRDTNVYVPWSFTPDGTRLAYHAMSASTAFDLWTVCRGAGRSVRADRRAHDR